MTGDSCGGIHPIKGGAKEIRKSAKDRICFVCHENDAHHFCYEKNAYIHAKCAIRFLQTEEAKPIIDHGHTVHLNFRVN